ncbi:hypothetical protein H359_0976 [Chlamydia ibidis 10-1398/6]|nr:hypothetical protein [Chlamydia ibidis]EQM62328.1 hypothetical protein H359_0976 [Chlamydia ibidis 10-1398/6]
MRAFIIVLSLLCFSQQLCVAAALSKNVPFGHFCADMHAILESESCCHKEFSEFVDRILEDKLILSPRDWDTISHLVQQYARKIMKKGDKSAGQDEIKRLLVVATIPPNVKNSIRLSWQLLNPEKVSLGNLIPQLDIPLNWVNNLEDKLLLKLYNMTLHSSYEDRKQEILLTKECGKYDEALKLYSLLQESIEDGTCSPHPDISEIETHFLRKTFLELHLRKSSEENVDFGDLLLRYCRAEDDYRHSIDRLVDKIAGGLVNRSSEVDTVLLAHALYQLPWDYDQGIRELEVLIDRGRYLYSTTAQYAYFTLLQTCQDRGDLQTMDYLLSLGERVFLPNHHYYGEYNFFLACYYYASHSYSEAKDKFLLLLDSHINLGTTLGKVYEYLGCIACRENKLREAEDFFLKSYKNWGREEAALGLNLVLGMQNKVNEFEKFSKEIALSFINQEIIQRIRGTFLNTSINKSRVMKSCNCVAGGVDVDLEQIYHDFIYDMFVRSSRDYSTPVLCLINEIIDHVEEECLTSVLREINESDYRKLFSLWLDVRKNDLYYSEPGCLSFSSYEDIIRYCYLALYKTDPSAINALPQFFKEDHSSLQSILRLIWSVTKSKVEPYPSTHFDDLDSRLYGDRLYLLMYSMEDYLSGQEDALIHLDKFPNLFPTSSLTALVYYLQSCAETTAISKISWLVKSLDEFSQVTLSRDNVVAWTYVYYMIKLDLADACLDFGDIKRAKMLFEEVKTDYFSNNCFRMRLVSDVRHRMFLEFRYVLGLSYVYEYLQDKESLCQLLLDHVEHRLFYLHERHKYFGRMLPKTLLLCERFLTRD